MSKQTHRVTAALATVLVVAAAPVFAAGDTKDLSDFTCKEVMRLSGEDCDVSIAFVHGYMMGKNKTTRYEVDGLAAITDAFVDYCLDHPAEKALASFEKVYK